MQTSDALAPTRYVLVPRPSEHRRVGREHAGGAALTHPLLPILSPIHPAMISGVISVSSTGCSPSVVTIASTDPSRANSWHIIRVGGMIAGKSSSSMDSGRCHPPSTASAACTFTTWSRWRHREESRVVAPTLARWGDEVSDEDQSLGRHHEAVFGERGGDAAPASSFERAAWIRPTRSCRRCRSRGRRSGCPPPRAPREPLRLGMRPHRRRRRHRPRRRETRTRRQRSCSAPAGEACRPRRRRRRRAAAQRCSPGRVR